MSKPPICGDPLLRAGLGGLLLVGLSGTLLATVYAPTPDHAFDSIRVLETELRGGRLLRGLHHWLAWFTVAWWAGLLARSFVLGRWPLRWAGPWRGGVALFGLGVLALGSGQILPWGPHAHAALEVTRGLAGSLPGCGPWMEALLVGGGGSGARPLMRSYVFHTVVLPAAFLWIGGGLWRSSAPAGRSRAFEWPDSRALAGGGLIVGASLALAWGVGVPVGVDSTLEGTAQPHPGFSALAKALGASGGAIWVVPCAALAGLGVLLSLPSLWPRPRSAMGARWGRAGVVAVLALVWWLSSDFEFGSERPPSFSVPAVERPASTPDSPPFLTPEGLPPDPIVPRDEPP